ncbi:glycoside hydrolase family 13 protein [Arthrobacter sp. B10-11]|uniref:glycoside hydrolase family 13 protein n=1 Tax=Arthrobacter sp. B10-11 TaxID=3081160 RepID=UPI0029559777|nr:glycoside hydrolase family 13 protein [Arthrobacter sp. B10-11]MDV8149467.1 glycoside hydrolase family 13 protein [Arthrobacter sp. B10-11]
MIPPVQRHPLPHHDGSPLHAPRRTELGDTARLRVRVPGAWGRAARIWLRSVHDGEPRYDAARIVGECDGWTWWEAEMTVTNPVARYRFLMEADGGYWSLNAQGLFRRDVSDYADFRLTSFQPAPQWLRRGTIYQVFPDRFARSAGAGSHPAPDWAVPSDWDHTPVEGAGPATPLQFYGGDLAGVAERLDHIQELGADVIYLTPFFPARSNHRYDASTFTTVDPLLGGDGALVALVEAAHARGIKVLGDLTANHSGDAHEWFRQALADPESEDAGYYYFSADHRTYESWYGVSSLPKLNWSSAGLKRRFVLDDDSAVARWLRPPFSLDGWRIDVGNMTGRLGATDLNRDVARLIAERVRAINPDAALLAEATNDAAPDFTGEHWHGAMTYANFTRPLWSWLGGDAAHVNFFGTPLAGPNRVGAEDFLATHLDLASGFSWDLRLQNMNALNSHDTARAATVMIDGGQLLGAVMMFTLPGVPVVFAGDEFGLKGSNGEDSRTPMPWNDSRRVQKDLRVAYAALAALRRGQPALTEGGIRWLYAEGDAIAYIRESAGSAVLVFVARAAARSDVAAGSLSQAQLAALAGQPAFGVGSVSAAAGNGCSSIRAGEAAAAVWVLPGTDAPAV